MTRRICWLCGRKRMSDRLAMFKTSGSERIYYVCDNVPLPSFIFGYKTINCLADVRKIGHHLKVLSRREDT